MDIRKKKIKGYIVLSGLLIMCLCFASVISFYMPHNSAEAISNISQTRNLGNILVENYEEKEKIFDGNQLNALYSALLGESGKTLEDVRNATNGAVRTSKDFRSEYNTNKDLILTLGGLTWSVVYLSNTKEDGTGDPILTLWLTDSLQLADYNTTEKTYDKSKWSSSSSTGNGVYPANMYGTSYIRSVALNNGGRYATSVSALTEVESEQDENSPFAKFTIVGITGDLTNYITTPAEVEWQRKETSSTITGGANEYQWNFNNDAIDSVTNSSFNPGSNNNYNYQVTPNASIVSQEQRTIDYTAWKNDKIWLPSMAETGWYEDTYSAKGMWNTNANQRANSVNVNSWLRSAAVDSYSKSKSLGLSGTKSTDESISTLYAVRPAFHLNLAKAEAAAYVTTPQTKGDTKKYFDNGNNVTFELDKVNNSKVDINIAATDMNGNTITRPSYTVNGSVLSFNASQVGKYIVTIKPKDGECWADETNSEKSYTYYLKYHVTPLRFATDTSNLVYKGSKWYIQVENYIEDFMTVTPSTGTAFEQIPSGENEGSWSISATNAGNNYRVTVALKNTEFMEWTDNNQSSPKNDLTFNISQKPLNVTASSQWFTEVYTSKEYELTLDCADEDIGKLRFEGYYTGGGITREIVVDSQPVMSTTEKKVTIKLPRLSDKGTYKYILKLADGIAANGNYSLSFDYDFSVNNKTIALSTSDIIWRYSNVKIEEGAYKNVSASDLDASDIFNVDYNGAEYIFNVDKQTLSEDIRDIIKLDYMGVQSATNVRLNGNEVTYYEATFKIMALEGIENIDILTTGGYADTFTLKWQINRALFDLSNVRWNYTSPLPYNELSKTITLSGLPSGVTAEIDGNRGTNVNEYTAEIISLTLDGAMGNNYVRPIIRDTSTYIYNGSEGDVPWTLQWEIVAGVLNLEWERAYTYTDKNGKKFVYPQVKSEYADKVEYEYYTASGAPIDLRDIEVVPEQQDRYIAVAVLKDEWVGKYEINENTKSSPFTVGSTKSEILIGMDEREYEYDGEKHGDKWKIESGTISLNRIIAKYYKVGEDGSEALLEETPKDAGKYVVRFEIEESYQDTYELGVEEIAFEITKAKIKVEWNTEGKKPEINGLSAEEKEKIEYEYYDESGKKVEESELESGNTYKVVAKIKDEYVGNYEFVDGEGVILAQPSVSGEYEFEYKDESQDPNDPNNPVNPDDPTDPENPSNPDGDNNNGGSGSVDFDKAVAILKEWWQAIASGVSIVLILLFTAKGIGYASKRKENKKTVESKYKTFYATTGLFGLSMTNWTIIASVLMGVALLSFVFMLIEKRGYKKSVRELEDAKEEYARNREEMLYMRMSGNNGNMQGQGYAYAQPAIGMEDMRGMINEAVSAMLPNVQQYLPQQASANDELVQKLIEQNAQNEERIRQLTEQNQEQIKELTAKNNETIKKMSERNDERIERFLQKLTEQKPVEKTVEKEVAATVVANDEAVEKLNKSVEELRSIVEKIAYNAKTTPTEKQTVMVEKVAEPSSDKIDALIKTNESLMRNQEMLMKQIIELSASKGNDKPIIVQQPSPQIVEKVVEKPVEKIVEKEVVKEVKVEVPVEKSTTKVVPLAVDKATPKARVTAPRLTLDEAYAKLSAKQKKFFDTLKEYAMSKDKCKEKKSTYYILLGQSSVNPLVKLTIKKDCTVALFKMEDEYMKDIRRNATNDGTKVKVKETELIVGDAQALATAKEMIDLREDQIERYNDFLKEQRSLKKR